MNKKSKFRKVGLLLLLAGSLTAFSGVKESGATMYLQVTPNGQWKSAGFGKALAFKGKVLSVEDENKDRKIRFLIQEVYRGDLKVGEEVTLPFPNPAAMNKEKGEVGVIRFQPPPPALEVGKEAVLFLAPNALGKYYPIGGPQQGVYEVSYIQGKPFVQNQSENANVLKVDPDKAVMKQIRQEMSRYNTNAVSLDQFKILMQNEPSAK